MLIIVSYDINTTTAKGRRILHTVAKECKNYGIRVQNSVFECFLDWSKWIELKAKLESIINPETDSLRFYNLGNKYERKIFHVGTKNTMNPETDILFL